MVDLYRKGIFMKINKKLIKYNFTANSNTPLYIVIHDTGNSSVGANSEMHYQYFNSGNKNSSAHFFVDNTQILQLVEVKDKAWHVGDGGNKYGISNGNSIGIELCINSDGNRDVMLNSTIELIGYLMNTYNISIDKVVRHFDASRKNCPQTMNNNGDWSDWNSFKDRVKKSLIKEVLGMFNDADKIGSWAKPSVDKMVNLGLVKGDDKNNFNPQGSLTREQFCVVIDRLLALLGK